jgi:hypothetical protein
LRYRDLGETGMRVSERQKPEEEFFPLSDDVMDRVRETYDGHVRDEVHHRW